TRLREDQVGLVRTGERRDDLLERVQVARPSRVRREGNVHRVSLTLPPPDVSGEPRARKQKPAVLMEGNCQDTRVLVENLLNAVAMVRVDVKVQHALRQPRPQDSAESDRDIVEDAEPGRPPRHRMVEPTAK